MALCRKKSLLYHIKYVCDRGRRGGFWSAKKNPTLQYILPRLTLYYVCWNKLNFTGQSNNKKKKRNKGKSGDENKADLWFIFYKLSLQIWNFRCVSEFIHEMKCGRIPVWNTVFTHCFGACTCNSWQQEIIRLAGNERLNNGNWVLNICRLKREDDGGGGFVACPLLLSWIFSSASTKCSSNSGRTSCHFGTILVVLVVIFHYLQFFSSALALPLRSSGVPYFLE